MYPELFQIPFTQLTLKTYGLMMVVGFLFAVYLIRRLSSRLAPDPNFITNAALYSLIAGVAGARLFYVVHYFDRFRGDWLSVFAIWHGGLEVLGGVIMAITVIFFYLRRYKLPIRRCLDVLAIGLLLALVFGRIGCLFSGCCFGKPTTLPWGIRFPYASAPYRSQAYQDLKRDRIEPYLKLPPEFSLYNDNENGIPPSHLKPYEYLTPQQQDMVKNGPYRCLPVHPTQLYSSLNAAFLCLLLYLLWRRTQNAEISNTSRKLLLKPGSIFALMFVFYGITRFAIEFLRDDNPFEHSWWIIYKGATVSQNLGLYMALAGVVLLVIFAIMKSDRVTSKRSK